MGIGEFYALTCALLWGTTIILFKHAGNSMSADSLNLIKIITGVVLLFPTALFMEGAQLPNLSIQHWLIVFATGYIGIAMADSMYFQALRHLGAGRTAIVGSLYSPFVVILSILILGERLDWWKWFGFAMVLTGILIVIYQRHYQEIARHDLLKGITLAASSVFLTAFGVVLMKPVLENDGFFWIVTLRLLGGAAGLLLALGFKKKLHQTISLMRSGQHKWGTILLASFLGSYLAMIFWLAGFKYTEASVASVLNETSNIFVILMAWLFLKEKLKPRQLFGVFLTFAGVYVFIAA